MSSGGMLAKYLCIMLFAAAGMKSVSGFSIPLIGEAVITATVRFRETIIDGETSTAQDKRNDALDKHQSEMEGAIMDLIHARYFDGGDILGQPGVRGVSISAGTNDTELRFSARVFVTRERTDEAAVRAIRDLQDSRPLGDGEGLAALNGFYFNRLGINPDNFDVYVVAVEDVAVATPDESASSLISEAMLSATVRFRETTIDGVTSSAKEKRDDALNEHRGHMEGALMDLIHARFFDGADITGQPAVRRVVVSEGDRDDELQFAARIMMPLERSNKAAMEAIQERQRERPLGDDEGLAALNGFYFNRLGIDPDNVDAYFAAVDDVVVTTSGAAARAASLTAVLCALLALALLT